MRGKVAKVVSERGRKGGEARMADAQRFFCHQCSLEIPRWVGKETTVVQALVNRFI